MSCLAERNAISGPLSGKVAWNISPVLTLKPKYKSLCKKNLFLKFVNVCNHKVYIFRKRMEDVTNSVYDGPCQSAANGRIHLTDTGEN